MRSRRQVSATLGAEQSSSNAPVAGDLVAERYRLASQLGAGGMGQVWKAQHIGLDRAVAIKFVDAQTPELRERLLREAKVLASLRHPAIVEVFDCGEAATLGPYVAMELFEGESLAQRLESGPLPVGAAIRLFVPLLDGLACAHDKGIVHRDVKPANILVRGREAKLIDFGIAYEQRSMQTRLTLSGGILGTPAYMAPEQIRAEPLDDRADVWSTAITLLETLSGRLLFDGPDPVTVMAAVLHNPAPRPIEVSSMDDALWSIFQTALAREPADRPSAAAFGRALAGWLSAHERSALSARPTQAPPAPLSARDDQASKPAVPVGVASSFDALIRQRLGDS